MKYMQIFLFFIFFTVYNSNCSNVNSQIKTNTDVQIKNVKPSITNRHITLSKFKEAKTKFFGEWDVGEDIPFNYLVEFRDNRNILSIFDSEEKVIFEKEFDSITKVYDFFALRKDTTQLCFEYNEGGNDSFIQMLDFENGSVVEKIDSSTGENSYGSGVTISPQFRTGVDSSKEPFEILLNDFGLASSSGKFTRVLRYVNLRYKFVGKFERKNVDDYKEKSLTR